MTYDEWIARYREMDRTHGAASVEVRQWISCNPLPENEPDNTVWKYLRKCRQRSSEPVIARALGLSEHEVGEALDRLTARGDVRVVRRTRSSTT